MYRTILLVIIGLLVLFSNSVLAKNTKITVVTEDAYPLQFYYGDKVIGPATELVQAVLNEAKIDHDISIVPWARAYEQAISQENTLIYSLARTPERENKFKWVGSILKLEYHMVGLNTLKLANSSNLEALKKLKIGAIRSSVTHKYLVSKGFKDIYLLSSPEQSINLLKSGRIDLFPINYSSFQLYCLKTRIDCQKLSSKFKLEGISTSLFMAFSMKTPDNIVNKVRQAYEKIMRLTAD